MSGIFISHSSHDDAVAAEVKTWLEAAGHRSVFLDFDPAVGIPAGRSWEQELYRQLRACRAVVLVCSERSMASRWCFAEITHARSLGKPIFPLKVDACEVDAVLTDRQIIDLTAGREAGYERLARGLALAGIDASNPFDWDGSRPPYPGLLSFQEEDAAIFFGRDEEVGRGLDLLQQIRRYGGAGLLLVLGSSGSGKSSLVRAGMVPRLRRDRDSWLVVGPLRPGDEPWESLAGALAEAFERAGRPVDWRQIRDRLSAGGGDGESDAPEPLHELARDLLRTAGRPDATLLLVVDQFEELLGHAADHPSAAFLHRLAAALETPGTPLLAVATLRSDFLGALQKNAAIGGAAFRALTLGPISVEGLTRVIVEPARLAGVDMEPGLVQALLTDTRTDDALPLLAFTLRELWELATREQASLGVSQYRDRLGGLQGSVARAAEGLLAARPLTGDDEAELRGAFLGMVRMDEDGHFARDALDWNLLSETAQEWLERFVAARLLIRRGDESEGTVEVAHEALFRAWDKLAGWLDENREALILRRELRHAARLWEHGGRQADDLWRGGRLRRALEVRDLLYERRRTPRDGDPPGGLRLPMAGAELEFLETSAAAESRAERRLRRLRAAIVAVSLGIAAVMAALAVAADRERDRARVARLAAETRALATQARLEREGRLDRSLLLSLEVGRRGDRFESRRLLHEGLEAPGRPRLETLLHGHAEAVRAVAWSPDGRLLASGSGGEPALLLWDVAAEHPTPRRVALDGVGIWDLAWSPDGRWLAAGADDGAVLLWDLSRPPAEPGRLVDAARPARHVYAVAFSPDGATLAAARSDHAVQLWRVASGEPSGPLLEGARDQLRAVVWSPDGATVAAAGMDRTVRLWRAASGEPTEPALEGHVEGVMGLAWSPRGLYLASGARDGTVVLWDRRPGSSRHRRLQPGVGDVATLAWSPDAESLLYGGTDGRLQIGTSRLDEGALTLALDPPSEVLREALLDAAWSADGRRVATGHGAMVAVWSAATEPRLARLAALGWSELQDGVASPDGALVAAVGRDATTRRALAVWEAATDSPVATMKGPAERGSKPAWSDDGRVLVVVDRDRTVRRWEPSTGLVVDEWRAGDDGAQRVDQAAWSAGAARLALAAADGSIELWSADAERRTATTPVPADGETARTTALAWSPDAAVVAAGDRDGRLRAWDATTGAPIFHRAAAHDGQLLSLAWSPDGALVASGGRDGVARLWSAPAGEPAGRPLEHASDVTRMAWSPDGTTLATATRDRRLRLWDTGRAEVLAEAAARPRHEISALFFSSGGATVTALSVDGAVVRWHVDTEAWRAAACRVANRNLTTAEWKAHLPAGEPYRETCPAPPATRGETR